MVSTVVPDRGDIVYVQFNPQAGHEQAGYRPALVLSPARLTKKSGMLLACPISSKKKGYPFEVELSSSLLTKGVVLVDQVRSIDWNIRGGKRVEKVSSDTMENVIGKLELMLRG